MTANEGDEFKPGDSVPHSGIYSVVHDPKHAHEHQVTCVYGTTFPACRDCGHQVRFVIFYSAQLIENNEHFK